MYEQPSTLQTQAPCSQTALPEAAAVGVVVLGQKLPQGPVDNNQGDGELPRLVRVPLLPPGRGLPLGTGPRLRGLRGGHLAERSHGGALCKASRSVRWGPDTRVTGSSTDEA